MMPSLRPDLRDVQRVPESGFDQHIGGAFIDARMLAAHDAGDGFDAVLVGDHDRAAIERVGAAIERQHLLAVFRAADGEIALDLRGVENMQRTAVIEGHVVGDVDERIDRPKTDRQQAPLHPFRRRAVLDAAHETESEDGAELLVAGANPSVTETGAGADASNLGRRLTSSASRVRLRRDLGQCRGSTCNQAGSA